MLEYYRYHDCHFNSIVDRFALSIYNSKQHCNDIAFFHSIVDRFKLSIYNSKQHCNDIAVVDSNNFADNVGYQYWVNNGDIYTAHGNHTYKHRVKYSHHFSNNHRHNCTARAGWLSRGDSHVFCHLSRN